MSHIFVKECLCLFIVYVFVLSTYFSWLGHATYGLNGLWNHSALQQISSCVLEWVNFLARLQRNIVQQCVTIAMCYIRIIYKEQTF